MCPLFFFVSLLQCLYLLHALNHSACYNSEFIIDSPLCESSGYLAPKKFLFGQISPSSTCGTELRGQRDYHIVRKCCKVHNGDTILKEVCIPGQKALLPSPLSLMARYCSRGNRCDSGKRLTSKELFTGDYVSLEFDCVHAKDEVHVNSDEVLHGKNVYLISEKQDGSVRDAKCAAYTNNPQSSIVISLVDNLVPSGTCKVSFASSVTGTTTINCAKTDIVNGCNNVLYTSASGRLDISITMNVLPNNSDRQFLWMMASVSGGGNLTVACGKKIPPDRAASTLSTKSRLSTQTGSHYPRSTNITDIWISSTGPTQTASTKPSLPSSKRSSSLPQTYPSSYSRNETLSTSRTQSTTRRVHLSGHTSYLTRLSQRPSSLVALSSSTVTRFHPMETTKPTSGTPKHSALMSLSPQPTRSSPSSSRSIGHTSYLTRPTQGLSSSLFETSSSSSITPFRLMKTTKQTSHPETVSASEGPVPTPSSLTSTTVRPKSSTLLAFSTQPTRSSPSSSTTMMQTVPPSNVTSPQTNRTSSHQPSGQTLASSNATSFQLHTTTGTTYNSRVSGSTTVPVTSTATWVTTSESRHGSRQSTHTQQSKTNSMPDSSFGLQFTTSSSPIFTTLFRILTNTKSSLPSTRWSSSLPQTYASSSSRTRTLSPSLTHSTTRGLNHVGHTSYLTRPTQGLSSSLFETSSSSSITPFRLMKTTKQTSHPETVSASEGPVPTPSSLTSTTVRPKSSTLLAFSTQPTRSSPSSSTTMMQTVPPSNVTSPQTNRTSSHQPSGQTLASSNATSFQLHTTTGTTYNSRVSGSTTVPVTSTATWVTTSESRHGSRQSTHTQQSKTNSMPDSSFGLQFTTSSSPIFTTLFRILTNTKSSLPSTRWSSSLPQTYASSSSRTRTLSPSLTHSTTRGLNHVGHTSYLTRPTQGLSSSLFETSSSSSITPFRLMKTAKQTSHPETVSASEGPVPTPSSLTSTTVRPKSSTLLAFSTQPTRSSPSSSTTMMQTVPPSNVTSPQTNRTSSHQPSGQTLASSNATSFQLHTTTGTTYNSRVSGSTTVPVTSTATWVTTSESRHGSRQSTHTQQSKTNSMPDSSFGLQFTTSSSPIFTTLFRILTNTKSSLPSTRWSSSLPQTYASSSSRTRTLSPSLTHSTTRGLNHVGHTSYLTRPTQGLSSSLFETSSSSSITPFRLMKTAKQTSHPETVSASEGPVPTPSSLTSTTVRPKSSTLLAFSTQPTRSSPSSSTTMMQTVPPSNVTSPQTNRTSSHQPSGQTLASSNATSFQLHTTTGTTYNSRVSGSTTVPVTSTATWVTTSESRHGSRQSTHTQQSKTNSMPDSSFGLQFTTSSSPIFTTLFRILTNTKSSLPSTRWSSSLPQTYASSSSRTRTLSPSLTHSTTRGLNHVGHTSYLTRPTQGLSSSLFETSSSSSITPFRLMKTTKQTSHPETVSASEGPVPTPSSLTSTTVRPKSSTLLAFSTQPTRSSPSSSTTMMQTVPPSNVTSPQTNRTSSHQPSGQTLASSNATSFQLHTTTGTTYNSRVSGSTTVPVTSTTTWVTTSESRHGSRQSTHTQQSKTNSMPDSSFGLQFTTSSSPIFTTLFRILTNTKSSLPSTRWSSSLPQTYASSSSRTRTLSPSLTHSTTRGLNHVGHTSYLTRPTQGLSSSLFETSSSSSITPFRLMKTTKQTSHPETLSASEGPVPTPSSLTSTTVRPKSSTLLAFSTQPTRSSPSSSTTMMQTVPPSNVTSPQTNRTSSHQPSGPVLATSNTTSFESHTTTGTTYNSQTSRSAKVPVTSTATWVTTSESRHGSRQSTHTQQSKTNSMPDSSFGLQYTKSSSSFLSTLGRILAATTSLPSTKNASFLPQTYSTSHSVTETLSPAVPSGVTSHIVTPSTAEQSTRSTVNIFSMYLPTHSRQPPLEKSTWNTGKSNNNDDKIAFVLEVITSLTGATLLILMVITTAMCLCFKKRMNELKRRNSRNPNKLSESRASILELKRRSTVSLESGYCSNSIPS